MDRRNVESSRRILVLNWRDLAHPQAGGAEKVTHEIMRRWVAWGHDVTLFCASFPNAAPEEIVDGVRVVRRGSQRTVHWRAYRHYRHHFRKRYDIIIDEVNTIPFFAPLYANEPVIMFSHQLAREIWRYEAPFPLSMIGYVSEPVYLQAYRRIPIMTVSKSTRDSLRRIGLHGPCSIISEAVDTKALDGLPPLDTKERDLTLAFVGRVVPSKRVEHIISALALLHHSGLSNARLWIVGSCDESYKRTLDRIIAEMNLSSVISFWGYTDNATKERLLQSAHLLVMTSVREGWGLVVTEANMVGTPAIVYDAPGLRDSTCHGETGLICSRNTPESLADAIALLHRDENLYSHLRDGAWAAAHTLNWDRTAQEAWSVVEKTLSANSLASRQGAVEEYEA